MSEKPKQKRLFDFRYMGDPSILTPAQGSYEKYSNDPRFAGSTDKPKDSEEEA